MTDADYAARYAQRRFNRQLRNFLSTIAILGLINAVTSPGYWWVVWPALGMGIGLIVSYRKMLDRREDATLGMLADEDAPRELAGPVGEADSLVARAEALAERERATR